MASPESGIPAGLVTEGSGGSVGKDSLASPRSGSHALRGGSLRAVGYVFSILLSLIAVPLLIRHLGIVAYGQYAAALAVVAVVASLTEGGLNAVALRAYTGARPAERRRVIRDAMGLRLVLTTLGALAAVGFAAVAGYGTALVLGTALAGVGMLLQLVQGLLAVPLESELRFGWVAASELVRQAVNVAVVVGLVLAGASVTAFLGAAIPASAASLLLTLWVVRGSVPLRPAFVWRGWWSLVRASVPWAAVAAANVLYFRLAMILMSIVATPHQTGYFATSMRVIEVLVGIPALAVGASYPILLRTVSDDGDRFAYATRRLFELSLITGTLIVVCLEVGAPFIIHVLAGHKSDASIATLRIQGVAVLANFVAVGCGFPLLTLRRYRDAVLANLVALVLSGTLTLVLAGPLGARGAAVAALGAEFVLAITTVWFLWRAVPQIKLPLWVAPLIMCAGALATAAGLVVPAHPVIEVMISGIVYLLLLRLLGRFPPEVRELLGRRAGLAIR